LQERIATWGREWRMRAAGVVAMLAATLWAGVAMARDAGPALRIPLEPLGYQTTLPDFLAAGSSMLTVDFVDQGHLLVSFGVRRLMKRELDDPPEDDDRTVDALLVELPSGKVAARTEWRLHDRGQYLWSLGHGRFLLRVRDRLALLAPLAAASPEEAFTETPFLHADRRILAILLSADDNLLTVETAELPAAAAKGPRFGGDTPAPVQINFYRLSSVGPAADKLLVATAGVLRARTAVALPVTTGGFLEVLEGGRDRWLFNFASLAGEVSELAEFDTTCYPRTTFVSRSEFVAFGCRGAAEKQDFAGFNLKGEAMWQQNFFDTQVSPTFAFAPAAGRFALERTIVSGTVPPGEAVSPGAASSQEVRVYQSYNGKQLFRTDCTPVVLAGQNFALSPDGLRLAVVRETMVQHRATQEDDGYTSKTAAVEVYGLPALTAKDEAAVKQAQGEAPADTGARIDLAVERVSGQAAADAAAGPSAAKPGGGGEADAAARASVPEADRPQTVDESAPSANAAAWGDVQPEPSRKAPTLYGPGETPEGKKPQ